MATRYIEQAERECQARDAEFTPESDRRIKVGCVTVLLIGAIALGVGGNYLWGRLNPDTKQRQIDADANMASIKKIVTTVDRAFPPSAEEISAKNELWSMQTVPYIDVPKADEAYSNFFNINPWFDQSYTAFHSKSGQDLMGVPGYPDGPDTVAAQEAMREAGIAAGVRKGMTADQAVSYGEKVATRFRDREIQVPGYAEEINQHAEDFNSTNNGW